MRAAAILNRLQHEVGIVDVEQRQLPERPVVVARIDAPRVLDRDDEVAVEDRAHLRLDLGGAELWQVGKRLESHAGTGSSVSTVSKSKRTSRHVSSAARSSGE